MILILYRCRAVSFSSWSVDGWMLGVWIGGLDSWGGSIVLIRITQRLSLLLFSGIPSHFKPLTNPPAVATPEKIDMEMTLQTSDSDRGKEWHMMVEDFSILFSIFLGLLQSTSGWRSKRSLETFHCASAWTVPAVLPRVLPHGQQGNDCWSRWSHQWKAGSERCGSFVSEFSSDTRIFRIFRVFERNQWFRKNSGWTSCQVCQ